MTYREHALRIALWEAKQGVHEEGFSNRGKWVDRYQQADDLPGEGYAWCMAFVQWCFARAGFQLHYRTASVGLFLSWARRVGWVVQKPQRGDIVCFNFDSDNWPDHVGFVTKVLPFGWVRTVEGNTSSGSGGSQSDGGGVYRRTRSTRRCAFVRVLGQPK